jgi:lipoate-protein ligase A
MGVDDALLQGGGPATLRLYGWAPHAVSLGYFQAIADFADLPAHTPVVRRLTGGGAIHHGDEVTYSLACDASALPSDVAASYRLLHDAVVAALRAVGVACSRLETGAAPGARPGPRWCFAEPGRDDVVTTRGKLVGSAQRRVERPRRRILHHGSIVVRRPALTPFVAAAEDQVEVDAGFHERLRTALVAQFAESLVLVPAPDDLSEPERALATAAQQSLYASDSFLRRR